MEKMKMCIEVITPDVAREYLNMNTRNRAMRSGHINSLTKQMRDGKWVLNGQPIIFDDDDVLIDGQHRLQACVLSGVPIMTYVVRGVSDSRAFTTIDIGKVRGAHDMATYMGGLTYNQAKDVVAAGRVVCTYHATKDKSEFEGVTRGAQAQNEDIAAQALALNPLLLECVEHIGGRFNGMAEKSLLAACCYLFSERSKEDAFAFFNMLHDGVFSNQYDPIKVLRDTLLLRERTTKKTVRQRQAETMALIFKAWAAYRKRKEVRLLRWSREGTNRERFPELV